VKHIRIPFIYADNCKHCQEALQTLKIAVKKYSKITCNIVEFRYDSREALAIAVAQGIDDLPGFLIGTTVFKGKNYAEDKILKALDECI